MTTIIANKKVGAMAITTSGKMKVMAIAIGGKVRTMATIIGAKCKGESISSNHMQKGKRKL
jgi:hypothetical protein